MFGNVDLNEMLQKIQESMQEADNKTYTAKSGGGLVESTVNGKFEVIDIKIDDSLLEDKESLQILLMSAINDAIKMAVEDKKAQALNMFGGMNFGQ
ncbi:MAG: YbaB/EbfC family nucleoid-associated protein [Nautiliaceae bacterium]|jgi:DNA-binding YbaB/EbfC family protein